MALSSTALIRWWDCDAQSYIPYAYGPVFIPWQNGRYAAEISENGCFFLSRCFTITGLGMGEEVWKNGVLIRPNPARNMLFISSENAIIKQVELYSPLGIMLISKAFNQKQARIDISTLPAGAYTLRLETALGVVYRRVIRM